MASETVSTTDSLTNQRLNVYKSSLNLLKGRRYTFGAEEEVDVPTWNGVPVSEEVTLPMVTEQVLTIHQFVSSLTVVRKSFWAISTNLLYRQNSDNFKKREILEAVREMGALCNMVLSYEDPTDLFELKMRYSVTMQKVKERCDETSDVMARRRADPPDTERRLAKAKQLIRKLNTTRIIKQLLIGAFMSDHDTYPEVNACRTSLRRDLTLEDFKETWDVGCPAQH